LLSIELIEVSSSASTLNLTMEVSIFVLLLYTIIQTTIHL
jgi:hypothetical protein